MQGINTRLMGQAGYPNQTTPTWPQKPYSVKPQEQPGVWFNVPAPTFDPNKPPPMYSWKQNIKLLPVPVSNMFDPLSGLTA